MWIQSKNAAISCCIPSYTRLSGPRTHERPPTDAQRVEQVLARQLYGRGRVCGGAPLATPQTAAAITTATTAAAVAAIATRAHQVQVGAMVPQLAAADAAVV